MLCVDSTIECLSEPFVMLPFVENPRARANRIGPMGSCDRDNQDWNASSDGGPCTCAHIFERSSPSCEPEHAHTSYPPCPQIIPRATHGAPRALQLTPCHTPVPQTRGARSEWALRMRLKRTPPPFPTRGISLPCRSRAPSAPSPSPPLCPRPSLGQLQMKPFTGRVNVSRKTRSLLMYHPRTVSRQSIPIQQNLCTRLGVPCKRFIRGRGKRVVTDRETALRVQRPPPQTRRARPRWPVPAYRRCAVGAEAARSARAPRP